MPTSRQTKGRLTAAPSRSHRLMLAADKQHRRHRRDALAASGESQPFCGRRLDTNHRRAAVEITVDILPLLRNIQSHHRPLLVTHNIEFPTTPLYSYLPPRP